MFDFSNITTKNIKTQVSKPIKTPFENLLKEHDIIQLFLKKFIIDLKTCFPL